MRLGVDVSEHQAGLEIAGVDFAVLRTTDGTYQDRAFAGFVASARANGVPVAAYHYLRAPSEGTSVAEQVNAALDVLEGVRLPMWLDVESPAGLSLDDVTDAHRHFRAAGVDVAGVYTTAAYWRRHMLLADVGRFGRLWLAAWGDNPAVEWPPAGGPAPRLAVPGEGDWPRPFGMPEPAVWQFTSRGRLGGAEVDFNLARSGAGTYFDVMVKV